MFRLSNNLVGILNIATFLLSIPVIAGGFWLRNHGSSECEKFLETPVIVLGVFLMLVSLAGLIGSCCRVSWVLWVYLVVMFVLIVLLFCFTIFAFVVTNKGVGDIVSDRGYKEYRLGDYSNWLKKRVGNTKNWNKIKSCLIDSKVCSDFNDKFLQDSLTDLYDRHLSSVQTGCCEPPAECNFQYISSSNWTAVNTTSTTIPDCSKWSNNQNVLCYDCDTCKAGLLHNLKTDWRKIAIVNVVVLIFLIIVYSVGCCAFRNSRRDNNYWNKA